MGGEWADQAERMRAGGIGGSQLPHADCNDKLASNVNKASGRRLYGNHVRNKTKGHI